MNMVSMVSAEKDVQSLDGEFQLAELEQRLETVAASDFYYCCMCFNNVACQM